MNRRAFLVAALGGITVAGIGRVGSGQAATQPHRRVPAPHSEAPDGDIASEMKAGLDRSATEYSRYYYYRRRPRFYIYRYWRPRYYRRYYYSRPIYYYRRFY